MSRKQQQEPYRQPRDGFFPLTDAEVIGLTEKTGLPLTDVVRIGEPGHRPYNRAYGRANVRTVPDGTGEFLIDLDKGEVLEELTSPPWLCPRCEQVHPKVDPCPKPSLSVSEWIWRAVEFIQEVEPQSAEQADVQAGLLHSCPHAR